MVSALAGCSNSFFKTKNVVIDDVITLVNEDGDLVITITFVDDVKGPLSFTVPQGDPGNGIANITQTPKPDGSGTVVKITYTDESIAPLSFEIKNGTSIVSITSAPKPSNPEETIVTILLSNGESLEFEFSKPQDGKDGTSITGITVGEPDENGNLVLTIHFTNDLDDVVVTIPSGREGNSIVGITMRQVNFLYEFTFIMANGETHVVSTNRPATWISGFGAPDALIGITGDYYYDRTYNVIYVKSPFGWEIQIDFNKTVEQVFYTVKFDLNSTIAPYPGWSGGTVFPDDKPEYKIERGHTFYDAYVDTEYSIPIPFRDGYTFNGWFTQKNPTINSSRFGDLVNIYRDMVLYANWVLL